MSSERLRTLTFAWTFICVSTGAYAPAIFANMSTYFALALKSGCVNTRGLLFTGCSSETPCSPFSTSERLAFSPCSRQRSHFSLVSPIFRANFCISVAVAS